MSERTIIAVVSDLIKSGLTVEQQILVNELVLVAAEAQHKSAFSAGTTYGVEMAEESAKEAARSKERERKRAYRTMSQVVPGCPRDKRKEPKENNIYIYKNPLEGVQGKPLSRDKRDIAEPLFEAFWEVYPRKVGKGAARKAFRHASSRATAEAIIAGAKRYAASKPDLQYTKHPATWLNAECWLDEGIAFKLPVALDAPKRTWAEIKAEKEGANK